MIPESGAPWCTSRFETGVRSEFDVQTLVLDQSFRPIQVITWEDAVRLYFLGKAQILAGYEGVLIHSPSTEMEKPAVVRLCSYTRNAGLPQVAFSRKGVYVRDGHICQYCGQKFPARDLTLDHVVPRSCGGPMSWTNIVSSCTDCNLQKANRTPKEAKMPLLSEPHEPGWNITTFLSPETVPEPWKFWISGFVSSRRRAIPGGHNTKTFKVKDIRSRKARKTRISQFPD